MKKNMMKRICLILILIVIAAVRGIAQDSTVVCKYHAWGFYPSATYYRMNFNNINAAPWMLGKPKNDELMVGAGVNYGNPANYYFSADFAFDVLTVQASSGSFDDVPTLNLSYTSFRFGLNGYYPIIKKYKYGVYANVGTSFERVSLQSENLNAKNADDTITVFENFTLKQNLLLNGGLSFYFYNKKFGFATGLLAIRVGYDWAPLKPSAFTWYDYYGNTRIQSSPQVSFDGYYAGIVLNIWFTNNVVCKFR